MFPLRLCGGKLLVAVTRERRYGPSRLRINDDDDWESHSHGHFDFWVNACLGPCRGLLSIPPFVLIAQAVFLLEREQTHRETDRRNWKHYARWPFHPLALLIVGYNHTETDRQMCRAVYRHYWIVAWWNFQWRRVLQINQWIYSRKNDENQSEWFGYGHECMSNSGQ